MPPQPTNTPLLQWFTVIAELNEKEPVKFRQWKRALDAAFSAANAANDRRPLIVKNQVGADFVGTD